MYHCFIITCVSVDRAQQSLLGTSSPPTTCLCCSPQPVSELVEIYITYYNILEETWEEIWSDWSFLERKLLVCVGCYKKRFSGRLLLESIFNMQHLKSSIFRLQSCLTSLVSIVAKG